MEIIEKKIIDKIEIAETNSIQVRTASIIEKDGVQIAKTYFLSQPSISLLMTTSTYNIIRSIKIAIIERD